MKSSTLLQNPSPPSRTLSPGRKHARLAALTLACDAAAVALAFLASYAVRFDLGLLPLEGSKPDFARYAQAFSAVLPVMLFFFRAYGLYQRRYRRRIEEMFLVAKASSFAVLALMALTFLYRGFSYSRLFLVILWGLSAVTVGTARYLLIQIGYRRRRLRQDVSRVLLVGVNRNARSLIQWAKDNPHYGLEVIGVLARDTELVGKHLEGVAIAGTGAECESFMDELGPDLVILVDPDYTRHEITDLVAACEDRWIDFKVAADFYGLMTRSVNVENVMAVPLLGFKPLPLDDPWNRALKRAFDVAASALLLVLSAPFWLLACVLIKADDGGPLLYRQERMGRDQRLFGLLKFRTMRVDAESQTGPVWAGPNDSRRTRVGNLLRRWNLDELPQLLNVLKGEMSLVGPRPERPHFIDRFRESIPRYMARHKIKSGITGWAQVNGYRGNTSIQERIKYDLHYMENWSLLLDIEILLMTLFAYKNAY